MKKIKQDGERQAKFDFAMSIDMIGEFDDRFCFPPSRPDPLFDKYISNNKSSLNPFSDVINDHNVNKVEVKAVAEVKKGDSGKDDSRKSKGESKNDYKGCENYMHNYSKMDFSRGEEKTRDCGKEMKQQQQKEEKEVMAENAKEGKKSESKDEEKKDGVDDVNEDKTWRIEKSGEVKKEHNNKEKCAEEKTNYNQNGGESERMKDFKSDEYCHEVEDEEEEDGGDDDDRESVEKLDGHIISKNIYADVEGVEELGVGMGVGVGVGGGVEREIPFNEFLISRGAGQSLTSWPFDILLSPHSNFLFPHSI